MSATHVEKTTGLFSTWEEVGCVVDIDAAGQVDQIDLSWPHREKELLYNYHDERNI